MNRFEAERRFAQRMKDNYPPGTRIMLLSMDDPYAPVPEGTKGTVAWSSFVPLSMGTESALTQAPKLYTSFALPETSIGWDMPFQRSVGSPFVYPQFGKSTCFDAQVGTNISDKYRYVVRACASGKKGEFSEAVKAQKAESCNILPPEKPILQAVACEKQRIDLFWTPVKANALLSHYEIYRNGEKIAATTDAYVCTYRDRTVSFGKTYTYSVAAVNKFGNKSVSDAVVLPHTSDMFARADSKTAKKRHKSLYSLLMLKK